MIKIIITSDIKIYGEGLSQILADESEIEVTGIATHQEHAVEMIATCRPDIILLDMTMAGSCQLADFVAQSYPTCKIVALAVSYNESNIMQCVKAGITCYVPREASVKQLVEATIGATKDECYCPPKIAACLFKKIQHSADEPVGGLPVSPAVVESGSVQGVNLETRLTRRERQIARLMGAGLSNKQIARDLSIEVSTVKNHVHNVLVKLEVKNRSQAFFLLQKSFSGAVSGSLDLDPRYNHF